MVLLVWSAYSTELASTLASGASTPWPMVDRWLDPELRTLDPSCHADELRQSLYMRGFLVTEWLGIDRTTAMAFSLLLGFVAVAYASVVLVRSFSPFSPPAAWLLFAMWNLATLVPKVDLANFTGGLTGLGQMYEPAFACGLLAIAAVLRRSWIVFGCFVAIGALCHIAIAFYFAAVAVVMALPALRREDWPRFAVGVLIAVGVSGAWAVGIAADMPEQMTKFDWMRYARFGNYHWFPVDLGLFGKLHHRSGFTIFLCIALCGMVAIRFVKDRRRRRQWWLGVCAALVLTVAGIGAGIMGEEPAFVKLGMHRASAMVTQLSMLVVVLFLVEAVRSRGAVACLGILVVFFATAQGIGPAIALVLLILMLMQSTAGTRWVPLLAIGMLVAWLISVWFRGHLGGWQAIVLGTSRDSSWGDWRLIIFGDVIDVSRSWKWAIVLLAWIVVSGIRHWCPKKTAGRSAGFVLILSVVMVIALAHASTVAWE
ncbi:MAG: hypothetical protein QMB94_12945, partial [Phycisphaerales bacterium]